MNEIRPSRSTRSSWTPGDLHLAQRSYARSCWGVLAAIAQAAKVRARQPDPTIAKAVFTVPARIQLAGFVPACGGGGPTLRKRDHARFMLGPVVERGRIEVGTVWPDERVNFAIE